MRILLTGATGFIGSAILKALVQHGHHVHAVSRTYRSMPPCPQVEWWWGDVADEALLNRASFGCEVFIHAAGRYTTVFAECEAPCLYLSSLHVVLDPTTPYAKAHQEVENVLLKNPKTTILHLPSIYGWRRKPWYALLQPVLWWRVRPRWSVVREVMTWLSRHAR